MTPFVAFTQIIQIWLSPQVTGICPPSVALLLNLKEVWLQILPETICRSSEHSLSAHFRGPSTWTFQLGLGWSLREPKGRLGRATAQPSTPSLPLPWGNPKTPRAHKSPVKCRKDPLFNPSCPLKLRPLSPAEHLKLWMGQHGLGAELGSRWRELNHSAEYGGF